MRSDVQGERNDAEVLTDSGPELDLADQESQATVVLMQAGSGRKDCGTFTIVANPAPGKSKRAWVGVCKFCQEKVVGKKASL